MNILSAYVLDRRPYGEYVEPELHINTDEEVDEIGEPHTFPNLPHYRIIPCGPFVAVEYCDLKTGKWYETFNLSRFNALNAWKEQLIDVKVFGPEQEETPVQLGVSRARRLLRRHEPDWQIILSDNTALSMRGMYWRLERKVPRCFGGPGAYDCKLDVIATVWYGGAHVPLCERHQYEHNASAQEARKANN